MKEDESKKGLVKNQVWVCDISYVRYSEKRFTQIYKVCMSLWGAQTSPRKLAETSVFGLSYKCVNSLLEDLKVILLNETRNV